MAGALIAILFLYGIYHFLPLGLALSITGGCLSTFTLEKEDKRMRIVGLLGSWVYPIGVIYSFIYHGWLIGLVSIVVGFMAYRYGKARN